MFALLTENGVGAVDSSNRPCCIDSQALERVLPYLNQAVPDSGERGCNVACTLPRLNGQCTCRRFAAPVRVEPQII